MKETQKDIIMSDEEREKHKKHIENVIEETFKIIKLVYANQQEKEGLKGSKNGSRIIFPQKRKKMETRLSEQELRFIFVEQLNKEIDGEWNVYYSVETPTKKEYGFSNHNKKESGNIDLVIHNSKFERIALIEFKAKNPSEKFYQKDFERLTTEPDDSLRYFIQIIENTYNNTKGNIENKVKSNAKWGKNEVRYICHSISSVKALIDKPIKQ